MIVVYDHRSSYVTQRYEDLVEVQDVNQAYVDVIPDVR